MIDGKRVLAFVPARSGSKGVPNKNVRDLCGKPLMAYTIEAALGCSYVDACLVSTDSEDYARVARSCGAWVPFLRPAELAGDKSGVMGAVMDALARLDEMGERFDVLCLLQATSPLRTSDDLTAALECFLAYGCRGLVSVSEVKDHPTLMRVMAGEKDAAQGPLSRLEFGTRSPEEGTFTWLSGETSTVRRQDMPRILRVNGAIYINLVSELTPETSLNDNPVGHLIDQAHSIDIDAEDDFLAAQHAIEG